MKYQPTDTKSKYDFEDTSKCFYCEEPDCSNCKVMSKYRIEERKSRYKRKKMRKNEGYLD